MMTMSEEAELVEAKEFAQRCANSPVGVMVQQLDAIRELPQHFRMQFALGEEAVRVLDWAAQEVEKILGENK